MARGATVGAQQWQAGGRLEALCWCYVPGWIATEAAPQYASPATQPSLRGPIIYWGLESHPQIGHLMRTHPPFPELLAAWDKGSTAGDPQSGTSTVPGIPVTQITQHFCQFYLL